MKSILSYGKGNARNSYILTWSRFSLKYRDGIAKGNTHSNNGNKSCST
jgi:hypothetical protein